MFVESFELSFDLWCLRVADASDEVQKLRPARYIQSDGIIRPYVYREAEGHQILQVKPACCFEYFVNKFNTVIIKRVYTAHISLTHVLNWFSLFYQALMS